MTVPNFFLVGAAKAGTTALTDVLSRHPQFSLPYKEPGYVSGWLQEPYRGLLAEHHQTRASKYATLDAYLGLYQGSSRAKIICDASTSSLPAVRSADVIYAMAPRAKVMAILRQPVDRAFSHFSFNRANSVEPETDFLAFIRSEPERIRQRWIPTSRYMEISHYPAQVQRFRRRFDPAQLFLITYDDWTDRPQALLSRLQAFLELDATVKLAPGPRRNETALPRRTWKATAGMRHALKSVLPRWLPALVLRRIAPAVTTRPRLDPQLRHELTALYFRADILELENMLGRDLSHWLI